MLFRRYGTATLRATRFTAPSGTAERLALNTQPTGGVTGVALGTQPIVQATDINGGSVTTGGIVVTVAIASGSGSLSGTTAVATSAANGRATFTNLVITGTGSFTLIFTAPGMVSVTSQSITVAAANDPTQLNITTQPAGATWGVAFTTQPVVRLLDAGGSPATVASVVITASIGSGSGSLVGTVTATTNASGIATFSTLGIAGSGAHTVAFASGALTGATSSSVTVAAATKVVMVVQPSGSVSGVALTTQPSVRLQSAASVNVLRSGVSVTAAIASGSGTLSGTTSVSTDASGIATFTNLTITGSGSYTLSFASSGLTSVTSASFGAFNPIANLNAARFTIVEQDYQFNTAIAAPGNPNVDENLTDGSGWFQIFNTSDPDNPGFGLMTRGADASAPFNPPNVLEWHYLEGSGSPSSSTGAGNLFRRCTAASTGWYAQFSVWHDASFPWNPVSNKMFAIWNTAESGSAIIESVHFADDVFAWQFEHVSGVPYYKPNTAFGLTLTKSMLQGVWWNIEIEYLFGTTTGSLKVWAGRCNGADGSSGQLILNQTNINCPVGRMVQCNSTWGGGSGPIPRDGYRRFDQVYLARD